MLKKGFTLIELLVVIAIMAVIGSAVLVGIDPVDKLNAANDSKIQANVGQIATAITAYSAANDGNYPADLNALVTNGDLTSVPAVPDPVKYPCPNYNYAFSNAAPVYATISCDLNAKKYTTTPYWVWCSAVGTAGVDADGAVAGCP